jgi:hypothetical protein
METNRISAVRLCDLPWEDTEGCDWPPLTDEAFWLPRLLDACRARGWEVRSRVGDVLVVFGDVCCEGLRYRRSPAGDTSPAGLVVAMLAAEAAEGMVDDGG